MIMMQNWFLQLVILSVFLFLVYAYYAYTPVLQTNKVVRVAVLLSDGMYVHEQSYQGFLDKCVELGSAYTYQVKPFFFHGLDTINISNVAEALIESNPDVVVTIGSMGTTALVELMRRRSCKTPHVFIGVSNSVELGIVQSLDIPGDNVTGVMTGGYDKLMMAHFLYAAKPMARKVLIPYDLTKDFDQMSSTTAKISQEYLAAKGIETTILPIVGLSEAVKMISSAVGGHDVVMGLEIDSLVTISAALVKTCCEQGITCFTGTIEGADAGSLFSFGTQPMYTGAAGFDMVRKIIEEGQSPATLPVWRLDNSRQFIINTRYAAEQGMSAIDTDAIRLRITRDKEIQAFSSRVKVIK